jgi:hypothetical protein
MPWRVRPVTVGLLARGGPGGDTGDNDDPDPAQEQEWLRESDLSNGGLILIGVYMVQPFLTAGSLDLSARICVVAFAVAIPRPSGPEHPATPTPDRPATCDCFSSRPVAVAGRRGWRLALVVVYLLAARLLVHGWQVRYRRRL